LCWHKVIGGEALYRRSSVLSAKDLTLSVAEAVRMIIYVSRFIGEVADHQPETLIATDTAGFAMYSITREWHRRPRQTIRAINMN
jgi:hypothetical protein